MRVMADEERAGKESVKTENKDKGICPTRVNQSEVDSRQPKHNIRLPTSGSSSSHQWSHSPYDAQTPPWVDSASPVQCRHS